MEHQFFPLIIQDPRIKVNKINYWVNSQINSIWEDLIKKKLRDRKKNLPWPYKSASGIGKQKGLNICSSFKFDHWNSNSYNSIKLNFNLLNRATKYSQTKKNHYNQSHRKAMLNEKNKRKTNRDIKVENNFETKK
jgi:hypothetical protein